MKRAIIDIEYCPVGCPHCSSGYCDITGKQIVEDELEELDLLFPEWCPLEDVEGKK